MSNNSFPPFSAERVFGKDAKLQHFAKILLESLLEFEGQPYTVELRNTIAARIKALQKV